jgi:hypothetical protein
MGWSWHHSSLEAHVGIGFHYLLFSRAVSLRPFSLFFEAFFVPSDFLSPGRWIVDTVAAGVYNHDASLPG